LNVSAIFDSITKLVTAAGAGAAVYVFLTENIDDVLPAFLTVWGLAYLVLLGLAGALSSSGSATRS